MKYFNSVDRFMDEVNLNDIHGEKVEDVYAAYMEYCEENEYLPFSKIGFSRMMCKHGVKVIRRRVNKKLTGVYEIG